MATPLRKLRLRSVWLLVVPFFYFATPSASSLAVGGALALVGLLIRAWAAGSIEKDRELATGGPYAYTRNPLYLGSFFLGLGVTMAGRRWVFMVLFLVFYATVYRATAVREQALLEKVFGDPYRRYAAAVPFFVPRLVPHRDPVGVEGRTRDFSVSQYVRNREWEAGLGALAGFGGLALKMVLLG